METTTGATYGPATQNAMGGPNQSAQNWNQFWAVNLIYFVELEQCISV
jgi:hypothetical protein